jgi:hypothetical protein
MNLYYITRKLTNWRMHVKFKTGMDILTYRHRKKVDPDSSGLMSVFNIWLMYRKPFIWRCYRTQLRPPSSLGQCHILPRCLYIALLNLKDIFGLIPHTAFVNTAETVWKWYRLCKKGYLEHYTMHYKIIVIWLQDSAVIHTF